MWLEYHTAQPSKGSFQAPTCLRNQLLLSWNWLRFLVRKHSVPAKKTGSEGTVGGAACGGPPRALHPHLPLQSYQQRLGPQTCAGS